MLCQPPANLAERLSYSFQDIHSDFNANRHAKRIGVSETIDDAMIGASKSHLEIPKCKLAQMFKKAAQQAICLGNRGCIPAEY